MLSEREDIAIAEIAVYIPFIVVAIFVCIRHGFVRQLGWFYLVTFCALRIAGAVFGILYAKHPTSRTDATWSAILGSIGLTPLILAALGLLKRVNDFLTGRTQIVLALRILHLPLIIGLILAIIGGTRLSSSDVSKHSSGQSYEKAGGIVFLVAYVGTVGVSLITAMSIRELPMGEKRIVYAVLAALPLIAVRLLYSLLADFANNSTFNILFGNATVQLCMAIIEEMIVVVFFLIAGLLAPSFKSSPQGPDQLALNAKPQQQYYQNAPYQQQV